MASSSRFVSVTWQKPEFYDPFNHEVQVTSNYPNNGSSFLWGNYIAKYNALKSFNGLKSNCTFTIIVRRKFRHFYSWFRSFSLNARFAIYVVRPVQNHGFKYSTRYNFCSEIWIRHLNKLDLSSPKGALWQLGLKLALWFLWRSRKCEQLTYAKQAMIRGVHLSLRLSWIIIFRMTSNAKYFNFFLFCFEYCSQTLQKSYCSQEWLSSV